MNNAIFASQMDSKTLLIGAGNLRCGDDGAGIQVARMLKSRGLPGLDICEIDVHSGIPSALPTKPAAGPVFIVNATISGQRPGYVHRCESRNGQLPEHLLYPGLHGVQRWSEWLISAHQSTGVDGNFILYAIEGANFAQDAEISPEVQKAIKTVVQCLIVDIGARTRREKIPALRAASQHHAGSLSG